MPIKKLQLSSSYGTVRRPPPALTPEYHGAGATAAALLRDPSASLAGISFPATEALLFDASERLLMRDALALVIAKHTRARDRARARKPAIAGHHQLIIDRARRLRDNLK